MSGSSGVAGWSGGVGGETMTCGVGGRPPDILDAKDDENDEVEVLEEEEAGRFFELLPLGLRWKWTGATPRRWRVENGGHECRRLWLLDDDLREGMMCVMCCVLVCWCLLRSFGGGR